MYNVKFPESSEEGFFSLQIVTFLKRIESKGSVEGEIGDISEKIERDFKREGSMNAGASLGLVGNMFTGEVSVPGEEDGREG